MPNVLVVSPHFPPINAADLHRVRLSLPHFEEFGWTAQVLAVDPRDVEMTSDPILSETIPPAIKVTRVRALPTRITRRVGVGEIGVRAFMSLMSAGNRILSEGHVDLVYFSTTVFISMALGPIWKRRYQVPFVVDMQDAWVTDYYRDKPGAAPPKFWIADRIHRALEPLTMASVDGVVAVSAAYIDTLQRRYPRLQAVPTVTLPFGGAPDDFEVLKKHPQENRFFTRGDGSLHGVYVGRGGADMAPAVRALFGALRLGLNRSPDLFSRIKLHFVGTSYALGERAHKSLTTYADEAGVGDRVDEVVSRVPYFEALQLLKDSDFLIVPGSDDPQYSASKIYPYILAERPMIAVFLPSSSVCDVLLRARRSGLIRMSRDPEADVHSTYVEWRDLLQALPAEPRTDWDAIRPFLAREMTRTQCAFFEQVLSSQRSPARVPAAC